MDQGLLVLVGVFALSAVAASIAVHRALRPFRSASTDPAVPEDARVALRASAMKSVFALLIAAAMGSGAAALATAAGWEFFLGLVVIPLAAAAAGLTAYAAVPGRPAPLSAVTTAPLARRQVTDHAPRALVVACAVSGFLALALLTGAAVQRTMFVTSQKWGCGLAAIALVGLLLASWCALRRIAGQPALSRDMDESDRTIRGSASRVVLLLTLAALLTAAAVTALALGYAATSWANLQASDGTPEPALGLVGMALTVAGVAAVIGALGTTVATVSVAVSLARTSLTNARTSPRAAVQA